MRSGFVICRCKLYVLRNLAYFGTFLPQKKKYVLVLFPLIKIFCFPPNSSVVFCSQLLLNAIPRGNLTSFPIHIHNPEAKNSTNAVKKGQVGKEI